MKTGVSALSNTSNAFGSAASNTQIDENLKQAAVAEEEAALSKYKANVNSPTSASTNPFLSSPTKPAGGEPILDLFGPELANAQLASNQPSKAIDDLLQLGNPFADMFAPAPGTAAPPATDLFGAPGAPPSAAQTQPAPAGSMWANGFATQPAPNVFATGGNLSSMFNSNEPSVFDPMGGGIPPSVPQQPQVQPARPPALAAQKLLTGDLESSLMSLAENLTIDSGRNAPMQWNSPKNQPKPAAAGWQPQPMVATTAPAYRPMGQPMGAVPMQYPVGVQPAMGSPKIGNAQPQPPKQEVSFDPFGDL